MAEIQQVFVSEWIYQWELIHISPLFIHISSLLRNKSKSLSYERCLSIKTEFN